MTSTNGFRLQSVLNFKASQVDNLETQFAQVKNTYQTEVTTLQTLQDATLRQQNHLQTQQQPGFLDCEAIQLSQNYLLHLRNNVTQQNNRVEQAKTTLEIKREELVKGMQDEKTLENLRDKHQARQVRRQNRTEAKIVDDLVITRYNRGGKTYA